MEEQLSWKVTLADDSVVAESEDNKFDLAWEEPGAVKKIELSDGEKTYSCDLENGKFDLDGTIKVLGASVKNKSLFFRKRRQVRTDGKQILEPPRTKYVFGFTAGANEYTALVQPSLGLAEIIIEHPKKKSKKVKE